MTFSAYRPQRLDSFGGDACGLFESVVKYASMTAIIMADSLYFGIALHTLGHLIGGLTWEPLMLFVVMEVVWAIAAGGRWVRAHAIG